MSYLEELLPEFRKGAKIRFKYWKKNKYICIKYNKVMDEEGNYVNDFYCGYLKSDDWEFYQEPEPDWDYIIKNKCLCWFGVVGKEKQRIGTIEHVAEFGKCCTYYINDEDGFSSCRPVRKDEVTFYEERKDE